MLLYLIQRYTFLGWCVEDGGTVTYKPGASADNLAGEGTVTLYASWSLNKTFTYSHPYSYLEVFGSSYFLSYVNTRSFIASPSFVSKCTVYSLAVQAGYKVIISLSAVPSPLIISLSSYNLSAPAFFVHPANV